MLRSPSASTEVDFETIYWYFISSGTVSMDSALAHPKINLKHHAKEHSQTENKGTSLDCKALPPPNLFVWQTAAHFWSTVICLCQTTKRLQNEEGCMKRGQLTVAAMFNHTQTQKRKNCHHWIPENVPLHHPFLFKSTLNFWARLI